MQEIPVIALALIAAASALITLPPHLFLAVRRVSRYPGALNVGDRVWLDEPGEDGRIYSRSGEDGTAVESMGFRGLMASRSADIRWMAPASALAAAVSVAAAPFLRLPGDGLVPAWSIAYALGWGIVCSLLATIAVIDWRHYVIPDPSNITLVVLGLPMGVAAALDSGMHPAVPIAIGVFISAVFLGMQLVGGSGGGDTKMMVGLGFLLGSNVLPVLFYSALISVAYGTTLGAGLERGRETPHSMAALAGAKGRKAKKTTPFGTALVVGTAAFVLTWQLYAIVLDAYLSAMIG